MSVAVAYPVGQSAELLQFGIDSIDLLLLDDLWTAAVKRHDADAVSLGNQMQTLLERLRPKAHRVEDLLGRRSEELNAVWPEVLSSWRVPDDGQAIDEYLSNFGGLGDAGVIHAFDLHQVLTEELQELQHKIADLETTEGSDGDLRISRKVRIGIIAICVLAVVALPVVGGGLAATGVAAGMFQGAAGLASVAVGYVASMEPPYTIAKQLEELGELHRTGVLDDDEFAAKKKDLLQRW